jgi:hypothetical protein
LEDHKSATKIMEEKQIAQQESPEISAPDMATTETKPHATLDFLQRLVIYCPWLLVILLSGLFIGGGVMSLYSLGHVEKLEQKQISETPETVEVVAPITSTPEESQPLPLWMVGAIALSCASGCVVILRLLNRPVNVQTTHKHVNRYQARLAQRRQQDIESNLSKNTLVIAPPSEVKPPLVIKKAKKMVTIIPSIPNEVLLRKESLADSMDIRKENSLSSMLHKDNR